MRFYGSKYEGQADHVYDLFSLILSFKILPTRGVNEPSRVEHCQARLELD